ncbi:edeA protein [Escherichia coli P12b]|nr:edeA protein [Escherichia coli P12b]
MNVSRREFCPSTLTSPLLLSLRAI